MSQTLAYLNRFECTVQRVDHQSIAGAFSEAIAGRAAATVPSIPTVAEVLEAREMLLVRSHPVIHMEVEWERNVE
jgi:hypothetical protein